MMEAAQRKLDKLLSSYVVPVTRAQWLEWMDTHWGKFKAEMKEATNRRRQLTKRLYARSDMPAACNRIQPQAVHKRCPTQQWAINLENRTGWHAIKTHRIGVLMLFLVHFNRRTYYLSFQNTAAATGAPTCVLNSFLKFEFLRTLHFAHLNT